MIQNKLLLLLLIILFLPNSSCEFMTDLCKSSDCTVKIIMHTPSHINASTTSLHTLIDNTFVHSTRFLFWGPSIEIRSSHNLTIIITISNIKNDMCKNFSCWMRIRPSGYYNFKNQDFNGYYTFTDDTLILYSNFIFYHDNTDDAYSTNIQNCITLTSNEGYCFTRRIYEEYDILKPFLLFT